MLKFIHIILSQLITKTPETLALVKKTLFLRHKQTETNY